jgi:hypothetical protein
MKRELSKVHNSKSERFNVKSVCQLIYEEDILKMMQDTDIQLKKEKWNVVHCDF